MPTTRAKFSIGQLVHHKLFDYRGVVYDVDPFFLGSEKWYRQVARSKPPKDRPWYRVLVHGATHETYVAERNLEADTYQAPIDNPGVQEWFGSFENGIYVTRRGTC